jgi:hypothetical protein
MKTKFIKLTFQLVISSLLILSCENDEIIVETIENNNPKVKEATFKELSNDKNFIEAFSKIDKNIHLNNNSHARTIMENQYNFTIDDYPGKVIELDSLTSYTFSINNTTRTDSIFENLVVNHYVNGTTKAAIFKYRPDISNPSNNSLINEHNSKSFVGTTEIIPINYNANEVQQRQTTICFTSVALLCSYGNAIHPAGKGCGSTFWGTQTNCETIFTSPDFYTSIVQIIEDTGDNNGGATSISVGMALADNFANTQLTPEQKIIYDLNPSIAEYLAKNVIVIPVPNYDPLLGGDPTMAVIDPEAEQFVLELIDFYNDENIIGEDDLKDKITQAIANGITSTAEFTHKIFKKFSNLAEDYPSSITYINSVLETINNAAAIVTNTNPSTCTFADLFNMWLFELGPNPININGQNSTSTNQLKIQQGVNQARNIALSKIQNGDFSNTNHSWTYGQGEFYVGMANGNFVTAFLGSYSVKITISSTPNGYQLNIQVSNTSSWDSATRFRIDNDGNGVHDGVFPNTYRNNNNDLSSGGNFTQNWNWSEIH